MKGLSLGTELVQFDRDPDNPDYYFAQLAIGGVCSIVFSVQTPVVKEMDEVSLGQYLESQARGMIEAYGDFRSPKQDAFSEYMEA